MNEDDINWAISLCLSRKKIDARKILENIVQEDPKNGKAWLWLANTYNDNTNRMAILEECLKNNPENKDAQKWLATFKEEAKNANTLQYELPDFQNNQFVKYQDGSIPYLLRMSDKKLIRKKDIRKNSPFFVPVFTVGLLVLAGLGFLGVWIFQRQGIHSPQTIEITPSTSTPSLTSTVIPSPTASPSSTPSPTFTDTPFSISARVNINPAYLYAGPSTDHELILCGLENCIYPLDTKVILVAKHEVYGYTWFLVTMPDGKSGWLSEDWLLINGDQNTIPTASAYPTYPPSPTP